MTSAIRFARRIYTGAGIYGLLVLIPLYFTIEQTGRDYPPAITHRVLHRLCRRRRRLAARLPDHRPRSAALSADHAGHVRGEAVLPSSATVMYVRGTLPPPLMVGAAMDMLLCALFVTAYIRTTADARR